MTKAQIQVLKENILMGDPTEGGVTVDQLTESIEIYKKIGFDGLRKNLAYFSQSIMDTCQQLNIKMTIHPDDPPYSILGLPRIASSKEDLFPIIESDEHTSKAICLC